MVLNCPFALPTGRHSSALGQELALPDLDPQLEW
jgi:hypothetical protein